MKTLPSYVPRANKAVVVPAALLFKPSRVHAEQEELEGGICFHPWYALEVICGLMGGLVLSFMKVGIESAPRTRHGGHYDSDDDDYYHQPLSTAKEIGRHASEKALEG